MLTKKEIIVCSFFAAVVVGLIFGGEMAIESQNSEKKQLEAGAKSDSDQATMQAAAAKRKQAKQMQTDVAKWKVLLAKVEKYFPKAAKAPISNEQVARAASITGTNLVKCDKGSSSVVEWMPAPKVAEGEEEPAEPDEEAIKTTMVKYGEEVLKITIRGDYSGWMQFLAELEKVGAFFQLKDLKISSAGGKADPAGPLKIEASLASYRVIELPSDRVPPAE